MSIRFRAIGLVAAGVLSLSVAGASAAFAGQTPSPGSPSPNIGVTTCGPTGSPSPYSAPAGTPSNELGVNPSPCPTPTQPTVQPCPLVVRGIPQPLPTDARTLYADLRLCPGIAQEDFGFTDTDINPHGLVTATGPIRSRPFSFGALRDFTLSPTLDRLAGPFGSVLLHSQPLAVTVDRATCTLNIDQRDQPWFILSRTGTGIFRNDEGAGLYNVSGDISYPTRGFVCTLPFGLTDAQASWDVNHGFAGLPAFLEYGITANATGWVIPRPLPVVPPPYGSPSPYGSPTNS